MLLDCSWGTASAEQQHASATLVKKFHREIGTDMLLVRSLLHSIRHLLCQPTAEERQLEKLERQVAKLQTKSLRGCRLDSSILETSSGWPACGLREVGSSLHISPRPS